MQELVWWYTTGTHMQSLAKLFGCDTRRAWKQDFQFYINENRKFYLSGERPWKPGLTVL